MKEQNRGQRNGDIKMINAELDKVIACVLRQLCEEDRQTEKETNEQINRIISKLTLEGYVNEQE